MARDIFEKDFFGGCLIEIEDGVEGIDFEIIMMSS